jgi:hypothetical protein
MGQVNIRRRTLNLLDNRRKRRQELCDVLVECNLSRTALEAHHMSSRLHYRRVILRAELDLRYGACGSHCLLQIESSNALTMI